MNVESLKLEIINWLTSLEDKELLQYLKLVKESDSQTSDWWSQLTSDIKRRIEVGLRDFEEWKTISHEDVKTKYEL